MKKIKKYRYYGRNGILTTFILLDGINRTEIYELTADSGKILTDGERQVYTISVYEENLDKWIEIDDPEANLDKE